MRILICDDEKQYADAIRAAICRWMDQRGSSVAQLDVYSSSEEALGSLNDKAAYDVAFLDIQFPGEISGLQLARELRERNEQMTIVFISNYEEYAVDGYRVNALRFFYKPVSDVQIFECLDIAYRQWRLMVNAYLLAENNQQLCRVPYRSILYIESRAHYVYIRSISGEDSEIVVRKKLSEIMRNLPDEMFVQCHRSFAVNLLFIQKISRSQITLTEGTTIPISARCKEHVWARFKHFFQGDAL